MSHQIIQFMSEAITLTEEQKRLIERIGVFHEKGGMSPASGRVMALLTVSPAVELSFDQIRETLCLSKSATSNALNMLMNVEKVDYITHSGDRKRYFRSKISSWRQTMKETFKHFTKGADLLQEILDQRPEDTKEFNKNLGEVISFLRYMNEEIPVLFKKWDEQHKE